jgi:hypothetical protein
MRQFVAICYRFFVGGAFYMEFYCLHLLLGFLLSRMIAEEGILLTWQLNSSMRHAGLDKLAPASSYPGASSAFLDSAKASLRAPFSRE